MLHDISSKFISSIWFSLPPICIPIYPASYTFNVTSCPSVEPSGVSAGISTSISKPPLSLIVIWLPSVETLAFSENPSPSSTSTSEPINIWLGSPDECLISICWLSPSALVVNVAEVPANSATISILLHTSRILLSAISSVSPSSNSIVVLLIYRIPGIVYSISSATAGCGAAFTLKM